MEDLIKIKSRIEMMPVPRQVKFRVKGLFDWYSLLILVILGVIVMVGWESACRAASREFGVASTAIVDGVKQWTTTSKGRKTQHYGLYLKYPGPAYQLSSEVIEVTGEYFSNVKEGDEIEIYYYEKLRGYPMITGGFDYGFFYFVAAIFGVLIGLIVIVVSRQRHFMVNGMPVIAEITGERSGAKGSKIWTITYGWKKAYFVKDISSKGIGETSVLLLIMPDKPDSYMVYEKFQLWDVDDWGMAV